MHTIDSISLCMGCMTPLPEGAQTCPHCGFDAEHDQNQPHQLPIGAILNGKYLVGRALGQGGFGITYIGWDLNLNNKRAIKEYYPQSYVSRAQSGRRTVLPIGGRTVAFFEAGLKKFLTEAQALERLSDCPNIVSVRDYFQENGTAYIVMEYISGETLADYATARGGSLQAKDALALLRPLFSALETVHNAGLVHRDISPDNIMITAGGIPKLLDFGAVRDIAATDERSTIASVKTGYSPEEQYRGNGELGPWTDVYALCATLYKAITGVTPPSAMDRVLGEKDPLVPPNQLGASLTPSRELALLKGLSVRGKDRQQSTRELHRELYRGLDNKDETAECVKRERQQREAERKAREEAQQKAEAEKMRREAKKRTKKETRAAARKRILQQIAKAGARVVGAVKQTIKQLGTLGIAIAGVAVILLVLLMGFLASGKGEEQVAAADASAVEPMTTPEPITAETVRKSYEYESTDGGIVITNYIGQDTSVIIPSNVDGVPVIGIGEAAFSGSKNKNAVSFAVCASLTSITIPDSVTSIGKYAFSYCDSLTSITIPDSVTSIGHRAFYYCRSLTSVTIPDSVTSIGHRAFYYCRSLTSVTIPDSVTSIGDHAFYYCDSLTSITIPDSVTSIGHGAFYRCDSLTRITIPDSVTEIGCSAFLGTPWLTKQPSQNGWIVLGNNASQIYVGSGWKVAIPEQYQRFDFSGNDDVQLVIIPNGVTNIGEYAFFSCDSLTRVTIPVSVTSIGRVAFYYCRSLTSITIPDSVTSIGDDTFSYCDSLTSITIPDSVTSIGKKAFFDCDALTRITIPDSVTSIGDHAFYSCDSLTSITIPDSVTSIGDDAFYRCDSLTSITIPDSVTSIGDHAFCYCDSLTSITIPDSVTSIGDHAFYSCDSLTSITIPDSVTSIGAGAFSSYSNPNLTIHCPAGSYAEQYARENDIKCALG